MGAKISQCDDKPLSPDIMVYTRVIPFKVKGKPYCEPKTISGLSIIFRFRLHGIGHNVDLIVEYKSI